MATTKIITELTDLNAASSTSGLKMPSGGAFSGTATEGMMRNDTSQSSQSSASTMQFYNGTEWKNFLNLPGLVATENFSPLLYNGNGSSQVVTGLDFEPGLVWMKSRNSVNKNVLTNVIRGTDRQLFTDSTDQESVNSNRITSFNSNGFTIGSGDSRINSSGVTYVAWCWKAGGSPVTNNVGTIPSQVSANPDAGFSIVEFTSPSSGVATIGTGLNTQVKLIISKVTNTIADWPVFADGFDTTDYILVNSSAAKVDHSSDLWNLSNWSDTTFGCHRDMYGTSNNVIAYCFHDVAGYQKIGTYTGNGSTTGPTITTGFSPRFLMIKKINGTGSWYMYDNLRSTSNPRNSVLQANETAIESTNAYANLDFLPTGFQLKTTNSEFNGSSSDTYLYLAIA